MKATFSENILSLQKTSNDTFGGCNNVMVVAESDFDATEALLSDECSGSSGCISNKSSSVSLSRMYNFIYLFLLLM